MEVSEKQLNSNLKKTSSVTLGWDARETGHGMVATKTHTLKTCEASQAEHKWLWKIVSYPPTFNEVLLGYVNPLNIVVYNENKTHALGDPTNTTAETESLVGPQTVFIAT